MLSAINRIVTGYALALLAVVFAANTFASIYGLDNIGMVQAFGLDEARYVMKLRVSLEQSTLDPDMFFSYGNLYDTIGYYLISLFERFGWTINTQLIGFVLRFISIVAGVLSGLALWGLSEHLGLPRIVAAGVGLGLATMPDFVIFSRTMHPDTLQTLFAILGLGTALLRPTFGFALMSALWAGLAFSTKYVGAAVLPFSFLPLALTTLASHPFSVQVLARLFHQGLAMIAVFLVVFAITNPYAVRDFSTFVATFVWQMKYTSTGHGLVEPVDPTLWLVPLKEQFGIGLLYLFGGWLLAGLLLSIRLYRLGWRAACQSAETRTGLVLVLYILVSSAHLAISIHDREPRFTYHVVPFLLLLSTAAWLEALLALTKSVVRPAWTTAAFAALLLAYVSAQAGLDLRAMASWSERPEAESIKLGNSIALQYRGDTKVLADAYTYLPPVMTNVTYTNLQTEEQLRHEAPELIVLTRGATGNYIWKEPGTSFKEMKFVRDLRYAATPQVEAYVNDLLSPGSGWSLVAENSSEVLFARSR
ncbi:hypothetical protein IVA80_22605 [Bradyrhizobium sp. 139]|uniref:ArnT family glycosyltransferase n=1 Tax=Bradyrhizobium sp. 139 TaxID=2782616 RepID=UPI001FFA043B|nr:glycosyltransferase family 39 protein [Bradyrhizobium sp. 139]MCK1743560.1 hypothetical protein [Bradyrhizobium sp. 139]